MTVAAVLGTWLGAVAGKRTFTFTGTIAWAFLSKDTSLNRATTLCTYTSEMWRPRFDILRSSLERFHCIRVLYDYHKQRARELTIVLSEKC